MPITPEEVKILLQSLEHRGNHATGIALMVDGKVEVLKAPRPAWVFCAEEETNGFLKKFLPNASVALLHTRFATIGNPNDNANNHPMFNGRAAVVHNGGLQNYAQVFDALKVEKSCETDSDIFRAIVDKEGISPEAIKTMNRLSGSAAIAAITVDDPDALLLARSGSPLTYGFTADKLWWASEINAIQRAVRPWEYHHGLYGRKFRSDVAYYAIPDNTAYILREDAREFKGEFKLCVSYKAPNYNMRGTYQSKQEEFSRQSRQRVRAATAPAKEFTKKIGYCPDRKCGAGAMIPIAAKFIDFTCPTCSVNLAPLDRLTDAELTFVN